MTATSSEPSEAERQQKSAHGVLWGLSYKAALEEARVTNRPVLIDFTGVFCSNCRQMERCVMPRKEVIALMKEFVPVQLYTDQVPTR